MTGEWRKLHNEDPNDLYCSPNIVRVVKSRRMGWAGHLARRGERSGVYRVLVGEPEGKRTLGRPRRRWEDNIKMDLQEVRPPLWSSGQSFWLQIQRSRVRFAALPDFLGSSGSGTGSTQPREVN